MKYLFLMLIGSITLVTSHAQQKMVITYPIAFPIGNHHDYISQTSFRGISLEFLQKAHPMADVGVEAGWNVFYQKVDSKTYTEGTAAISGIQYRYTNVAPILAEAKIYVPTKNKKAKPYVGLGVGTLYVNRSTDFGLYRITNETWQFCLRPELGFSFRPTNGVSLLVGGKWYSGYGTSDLPGQSYISINVGLMVSM
jgi:opacity protein-like surface antigen